MKILNRNTNQIIIEECIEATTYWARLLGLMFKKENDVNDALFFPNCKSGIHTFFMTFNLGILILDEDMMVIKHYTNVPPNRVIPGIKNQSHVIEYQYKNKRLNVKTGDVLKRGDKKQRKNGTRKHRNGTKRKEER